MSCNFSVIIPLYNKQTEIGDTIRSVLGQTYLPLEIIVVDDGSKDGSVEVVRGFDSPLIKLITQPNGGECAARNRAMEAAQGDYFALLDADDCWKETFLEQMAKLIEQYPYCGFYCSAFDIVSKEGVFPSNSPQEEGIVENYFKTSLSKYVCIPSAVVIPRKTIDLVGGFPVGMKLAGDQFMWTKIVLAGLKVCYTPQRLMLYSTVAANRSASTYVEEVSDFSISQFYDPENFYLNEYLAKVDLNKAISIAVRGGVKKSKEAEKFYRYTRCSRLAWWKLWFFNRMPLKVRPTLWWAYSRLAWIIAKKGL